MKLFRLSLLLLFGLVISSQLIAMPSNDLEDAINAQFKDKVLILLHPLDKESLLFDADGKTLNGGSPGPWTVYGAIRVKRAKLKSDQLRLEGQRVFFRFESSRPDPFEFTLLKDRRQPPCKPMVEVEIKLNAPLNSYAQAQAILGKVFALNKQDFLYSIPEFWHAYARQNFDFDSAKLGELLFNVTRPVQLNSPDNSKVVISGVEIGPADPAIFRVGQQDVQPPHAIAVPEPAFSEAARYEKYKGVVVLYVVVDQEGNVAKVNVVKPLGLGLDEQAATGIKTWRFTPGMHNGQPVAVGLNIEVSFNLY
jgi:TonB family protein